MDHRERLLEAAIGELQERGYARTTTRGIVAAADSHLPAVNYYFGSKETLLHEAIVEALRRWAETTMKTAGEPAADPSERLARGIAQFLSTLEDDRPYVVAALEAFAQAERSEELRGRLAGAYADFRAIVARSVEREAGSASHRELGVAAEPSAGPLALASVLIALFDGLAIQWLLDPEAAPDAEQVIGALGALAGAVAPAARDAEPR